MFGGTEKSAILGVCWESDGGFLCHLKLRKEDPGSGSKDQVHLPPPPKFTKIKLGKWFSGPCRHQNI